MTTRRLPTVQTLTVGLVLAATLQAGAAFADDPVKPTAPTVTMPTAPTMPTAYAAPVATTTPAAVPPTTDAPAATAPRVWWTPPKNKTTHAPPAHSAAAAEPPPAPVAAPAPPPVQAAPVATPAAAPAANVERPWLRAAPKPAQPAVNAPAPAASPWRALGVLVVLGGLGGAALVMRKRRLSASVLPESATRVRVLSSARIGPKANAVVAEVGGRVILLGVTDTNVQRLAWLDRDAVKQNAAVAVQHAAAHAPRTRTISTEPVETAEADLEPPPERSITSRFGEVLDRALGVKPAQRDEFRGNPGVAALLAAGVEDVVVARVEKTQATQRLETSRRASRADTSPGNTKRGLGPGPEIIIEDQVAGLKRPRRRA